MKKSLLVLGMISCIALAVAACLSLSAFKNGNTETLTVLVVCFAAWMAHGAYRCALHLWAQRKQRARPPIEIWRLGYNSPAPTTRQMLRVMLNPLDASFYTSALVLALIATAWLGAWLPFFVTLIISARQAVAQWSNYMELVWKGDESRAYSLVNHLGVSYVKATRDSEPESRLGYLYSGEEIPWSEVHEVVFFRRYMWLVAGEEELHFYFFFDTPFDREWCRQVVAANFRQTATKQSMTEIQTDTMLSFKQEMEKARCIGQEIKSRTSAPCIRLTIVPQHKPSLTGTKLGGLPYWDGTSEYPTDATGNKMVLLAQFNLAQLPHDSRLPRNGLLQFFIADNEGDDTRLAHVTDKQANFRIVWHKQVDTGITPQQVETMGVPVCGQSGHGPLWGELVLSSATGYSYIQGLNDPSGDFEKVFSEVLVSAFHEQPSSLGDYFTYLESFDILNKQLADECPFQLFGHPTFMQYDTRIGNESYERYDTLLLQIPTIESPDGETSEYTALWGNGGIVHFFINSADLARMDFSRAMFHWDCP